MRRTRITVAAAILVLGLAPAAPAAARSSHHRRAADPRGSHTLVFTVEPADTAVGQTITGSPFNPSGPAVQVEILEPNGQPSPNSSAPVTITLAGKPGAGTLSGTTTVAAVHGVATFTNLSIDQPGSDYALEATSPRATPATSASFDEPSAGTSCPPDETCSTGADTSTSSFDMTSPPASGGNTLTVTVDSGTPLQCNDHPSLDPNWFSFSSSSTGVGKVITYTVRPSTNVSPGAAQFCLGAPYEFTTIAGIPAHPGTLPDGSSGFLGLLPGCGSGTAGPCVQTRSTTPDAGSPTGFDIVLTVAFPAGLPGDPIGRV